MSDKDTTLTPLTLIESLGIFDLDPCAFPNYPTAENLIVWPDDGLKADWFGRIWLNPPYSNPTPWLQKLSAHQNGIALVLASTETVWFQEYIFKTATGILFLYGRPKFLNSKMETVGLMRGVVLVAYGEDNFDKLVNSGLKGRAVKLF